MNFASPTKRQSGTLKIFEENFRHFHMESPSFSYFRPLCVSADWNDHMDTTLSGDKNTNKFYFVMVNDVFSDGPTHTRISHVLNEQGTGYEHIFSSVQTFNIDWIEKWGTSSERASKN